MSNILPETLYLTFISLFMGKWMNVLIAITQIGEKLNKTLLQISFKPILLK